MNKTSEPQYWREIQLLSIFHGLLPIFSDNVSKKVSFNFHLTTESDKIFLSFFVIHYLKWHYFFYYIFILNLNCEAKKNVAVIFHLKIQIEYNQYYLSETII